MKCKIKMQNARKLKPKASSKFSFAPVTHKQYCSDWAALPRDFAKTKFMEILQQIINRENNFIAFNSR